MLNGNDADADQHIARLFEELAVAAGKLLLAVRAKGFSVTTKPDSTPVTEADVRAESLIRAGLALHLPEIPVVAEEEVAAGRAPATLGDRFILVDALDGTREFIKGRADFTVNIALIRKGEPQVGVVSAPAHRQIHAGRPGLAERILLDGECNPASRTQIGVRPVRTPLHIVASRSHRTPETDEYLEKFPDAEIVSIGSSLKFCLIAAGEADLYPRFGPTMEWDTAAGDAVLRAAGGMTATLDGAPLTYGKRGTGLAFANPWFIARSG